MLHLLCNHTPFLICRNKKGGELICSRFDSISGSDTSSVRKMTSGSSCAVDFWFLYIVVAMVTP